MQISLKCPVCEQPLHSEPLGDKQLVFCAYGPCPSVAANSGAEGDTFEEARKELCRRVEWELEQNEVEE